MKKPEVCLAVGLTMVGLALVSAAVVWAQSSSDADRPTTLRARVDRLAEQLGNLELALGLTGIGQGSMNNDDNNPDKGDTTDANVLAFPDDNGPGARLSISPTSWIDVSGGWGESDADFDDLFEEPFFILEFDVKLNLAGRRGNYRFYV